MTPAARPGSIARGSGPLAIFLTLWLLALPPLPACGAEPFAPLFPDPDLFTTALAEHAQPPFSQRITGLTTPHHLLAVDLLAEAFSRLSGQDYRRVIILCPDHYTRSLTPFAVADRDFATSLGLVPVDTEAVGRLLSDPLVSPSNLFAREHGIHALAPFLARFFPRARLLAVAIRKTATPAQWDMLAAALTPLLDDRTLLIESTDFSHYLTPAQAAHRDQQTLRLLADPDPRGLIGRNQPGDVDCRGALYLERKLQKEVFHAAPTTVANRNSQAYSPKPVARSTSYMVTYYSPSPAALPGPDRFVFAGDAFFGRFMARRLDRPEKRRELVRLILEATGGAPLVVNLEGVLSRRCLKHTGPRLLCMPTKATLALLRELHVTIVGLANNHARDLGPAALARMKRTLARAGITAIPAGAIRDVGPFRLAALTDLDNRDPRRRGVLRKEDIERLAGAKGKKPLFVMIHWGREFADAPGGREKELARSLRRAGAALVIGAHPHRTWKLSCDKDACLAWSLGNFCFDQSRPDADGALLEVRFFKQGTFALRSIPLGNLYRRLETRADAPRPSPCFSATPSPSSPGDLPDLASSPRLPY